MKRLLDDALSADAARILRSAESDGPSAPEVQHARILEAYGAAQPSRLLRKRRWPVIVGTFVIASALFGSWAGTRARNQHNIEVATNTPLPMIANAPVTRGANTPGEPTEATVRVEDLPAAPDVAKLVAAPRPAIAAPDELVAIDAARAALRTGRPGEALARVAACRTDFPRPRYAEEADAIEVQALAALGRRDEARAKAARFFDVHPDSPYEQRIRAAITETQP